jgi:hypothetical protein
VADLEVLMETRGIGVEMLPPLIANEKPKGHRRVRVNRAILSVRTACKILTFW